MGAAGELVAVGLGVRAGPLAGVSSMLTLPAHRGRGFGEAVLGELARFCVARGVKRLYLQVERVNTPALRLYERAGFTESHGYHYRRR
jgi:ribosomal protein S18 acetylase RimI-like enzyme